MIDRGVVIGIADLLDEELVVALLGSTRRGPPQPQPTRVAALALVRSDLWRRTEHAANRGGHLDRTLLELLQHLQRRGRMLAHLGVRL